MSECLLICVHREGNHVLGFGLHGMNMAIWSRGWINLYVPYLINIGVNFNWVIRGVLASGGF